MYQLLSIDIVKLSWILIEIFGTLTIVVVSFIFIRRTIQQTVIYVYQKHIALFRKLVMLYAQYSVHRQYTQAEKIMKRLKFFRKGKYPSKAVIRVLKNYAKILQGAYHNEVAMIYGYLGFDQAVISKLNSTNIRDILGALDEMVIFGVHTQPSVIFKLVKHENHLVRNKAIRAAIKFRHPIFEFIAEKNININLQDRITLMSILKDTKSNLFPDLNVFLDHKYVKYRYLAVQMIHRFNLTTYEVKLINMLKNEPDIRLVKLMVQTIAKIDQQNQTIMRIVKTQLATRKLVVKSRRAKKLYQSYGNENSAA